MQKVAAFAKAFDDFPDAAVVGYIAACSPGDQNLHTQFFVLFQKKNAQITAGCAGRRHQTGGARADDDHVVDGRRIGQLKNNG